MASPYSLEDLTNTFDLISFSDSEASDSSTKQHQKPSRQLEPEEEEDLISFDSPPRSPTLFSTPRPSFLPQPQPQVFKSRAQLPQFFTLSPDRKQPEPKPEQLATSNHQTHDNHDQPNTKFTFRFPSHIYQSSSSTAATPARRIFTNPNQSRTVRSGDGIALPITEYPPESPVPYRCLPDSSTVEIETDEEIAPKSARALAHALSTAESVARSETEHLTRRDTASAVSERRRKTKVRLEHLEAGGIEEGGEDQVKRRTGIGEKARPQTTDLVVRRTLGKDLGIKFARREGEKGEKDREIERRMKERKVRAIMSVDVDLNETL